MTKSPETMLTPKHTLVWWLAVLASLAAVAFGIWCFLQQLEHGHIVTGHRNVGYGGAPWGLYIIFYVFFVGVSFAGITVSALSRLFHIEALRPATRIAELVTITALISGSCAIFADLGRPLDGLIKLPRFARPESPFYGTFTLVVAGYLFSSLVFFFLSARHDAAYMAHNGPRYLRWLYRLWATGYRDTPAERNRHRISTFFLSVTILPLLVTAHSTLGFIFGIQSGRPGWFGALQAPAFVILAGVSGTGAVILVLVSIRKIFGLQKEIPIATLRWLTNFMATLALVYLYFMVAEELTAAYAGPSADRNIAHAVVAGDFAPLFWTTVVCLTLTFAIPFLMRIFRATSISVMVFVAVLANIAAILKRFLIVVPSQTHGALLPIETGSYSPTLVEYGVVLGLFGIVAASILIFGRFFPLVPSETEHGSHKAKDTDSSMRRLARYGATLAIAFVAISLIVVGLADSFRMFSGGEIDPTIPYSPVIFAVGVMLLFCSAIVYETFPPPREKDSE